MPSPHADIMPAHPDGLRTDRRVNPLGIDSQNPEFSWHTGDLGQQWYELEVRGREGATVWESGRVMSVRPFGVRYDGAALEAKTAYSWRVRIGGEERTTEWSEPAQFETGTFGGAWSSLWLTDDEPTESLRTLYFHGVHALPAPVVRARAYASALGWYRLFVNGSDITGHTLVPRWTPLDHYVEYQVYDVTAALRDGENVVDVVVAEGRYRGRNGYQSRGAVFGDRLATVVQIEAELADGSTVVFGSDRTWHVGSGPIRTADPKHGERVDLRLRWNLGQSSVPTGSSPVTELPAHARAVIGEEVERVGAVGSQPGRLTKTPAGVTLVDFGQNFSGVARVELSGTAGTTVRLSYSEVLAQDGELDVHYLDLFGRSKEWFQRDEVILGAEPAVYTPSLTVHGFRYLTIEPLEGGTVDVGAVEGIVISTPLARTATFTSSHEGLNQLWSNVEWSMRSNFLDTATDCPTRERSGWTGDIQIFGPTASIMADTDQYLRRYLRNLAADQFDDGSVPTVIPREWSVFSGGKGHQDDFASAAGWGDTAVLLPDTLRTYFDDVEVIRRQYPSMKAWVDHLVRLASKSAAPGRRIGRRTGGLEKYIIDTGMHFGEWLRPGENMMRQMMANTVRPPAQVATAYFEHSARLLARSAADLGEHDDAEKYAALANGIRAAYRAAFVRSGGSRIGVDKQDDYVRALAFDLLEPDERARAGSRLAELIENADGHLATGFLSTPLLLDVLVEIGRVDLAYRVLLQKTSPSWLAQIERGATTVWETWEGYDKKGAATSSHNHYAFGSIAQWLVERLVGIRPTEPGYRRFAVSPTPGGGLTHAAGTLDTGYGTISVRWRTEEGQLHLDVSVPPGTIAEVRQGTETIEVGPGEHRLTSRVRI